MKKNNWLAVGIIGIVLLLLLLGGSMMMGGWGYHGWSMMGPGGMMNNLGYSPSPIGWIGIIFMWLMPVGLVLLAVFGIVWFVQNVINAKSPPS